MYQIDSAHLLMLGSALTLLYLIAGIIYRLYLAPIAGFPGPRLAAVTYWYETYYDVFRKGTYTFEIERMHQKYGKSSNIKG